MRLSDMERDAIVMAVMRIKRSILDSIGEQHLDLVVSGDGTEPFFRVAIEKGILINA